MCVFVYVHVGGVHVGGNNCGCVCACAHHKHDVVLAQTTWLAISVDFLNSNLCLLSTLTLMRWWCKYPRLISNLENNSHTVLQYM